MFATISKTYADIVNLTIFRRTHLNWLSITAFIFLSFVLASRTLYTSPDDIHYIMYFSSEEVSLFANIWAYVLEEPLWLHYSTFMGHLFGPELALRITIFISSLLFLVACNKLTKGSWKFILLVFIIDYSLATLLYFIQIRTGLALSLFLIMAAFGASPIIAAIIVSSIHTSFLVVIPFTILAYCTKRSKYILIISLLAIIIAVFYLKDFMAIINLGRRTQIYEMVKTTNTFFYVYSLLQFSIVALVYKRLKKDARLLYWFHLSLLFFTCAICMTFLHEAAIRLLFISNTIIFIILGANINTKLGKIGCTCWIVLLLFVIVNQLINGDFSADSWITRWGMILAGD